MRTNISLALLAAGTSATLLEGATSERHSFSLRSSARVKAFDGPSALRKAYLKYGIEVPEHLEKRQITQPPDNTGTVIAVSERNDVEYLSPVTVGGTTLQLDFDTGSSDLWVFSSRLTQADLTSHDFYVLNSSDTAQPLDGLSWRISYGDGSGASGIVFADRVTIGNVTATSQAVEAATSISSMFRTQSNDGILGLGFGNTNTVRPTRQKTWFENVKGSLAQPLFTVGLKKNTTGVYDFGFIDQQKYTGELQYVPVNTSRGYWEFAGTGFSVHANNSDAPVQPLNFQSIADTGTTLLLLPAVAVSAYYAQVSGSNKNLTEGGYVFPCSTVLPDLILQVAGNVKLLVPGEIINRGKSLTPGSQACYGGIQVGADNLSIWGDVFLKSQFVVFDAGDDARGPRIGFARQASAIGTTAAVAATSILLQNEVKDVVNGQAAVTAHLESPVTAISAPSSTPPTMGLVLPGDAPPAPSPSPIFISIRPSAIFAAVATATNAATQIRDIILAVPNSTPAPGDNSGGVTVPLAALLPASAFDLNPSPSPSSSVIPDLQPWATAGIPPASLTAISAIATSGIHNAKEDTVVPNVKGLLERQRRRSWV